MSLSTQDPMIVPQAERKSLKEIEQVLEGGTAVSISASGKRVKLPATVCRALKVVVEIMADGKAVTLVPEDEVITTQRAADVLGMSRPSFIKLLQTGAMAHHRVGNQRRVYLRDVLAFARRRERERQAALNRLSRQAFDAGLYDKSSFPTGGQDE
jgi:excisionase family DNA binding protein